MDFIVMILDYILVCIQCYCNS